MEFPNPFRNLGIVHAVFALTFILLAVYVLNPNIFSGLEPVKQTFKVAIGASAAISGVYLLHRNFERKELTLNELLGGAIGTFLLAFGVYVMFRQQIMDFFRNTVSQFNQVMPYVLAVATMAIGLQVVSKGKEEKGYILMAIGAIIAIVAFLIQHKILGI